MARAQEKLKALQLRRKGLSINKIAESVGVSKGSVSAWCQEIELTSGQREMLRRNTIEAGNAGRQKGAEMNKRKKKDAIALYQKYGKNDIGKISKRDLLILGVALYWAEGAKGDKTNLAFVNSDPEMILLMYRWFQEIACVKNEDFMPRIYINEIHKSRIEKVLEYWSKLISLPISQFGTPILLKMKQKKKYENHENYFGVLSLCVRRSTNLKYRILGLIDAVKTQ